MKFALSLEINVYLQFKTIIENHQAFFNRKANIFLAKRHKNIIKMILVVNKDT